MAYQRYERAEPPGAYPEQGYGPSAGQYPPRYEQPPERRGEGAKTAARVISAVTGTIAFIFVLHIIFSLAGANENNGIVYFVYQVAKVFVFGFGDVFTPNDGSIGLILNYGLAALIYLVVGRIIARALARG